MLRKTGAFPSCEVIKSNQSGNQIKVTENYSHRDMEGNTKETRNIREVTQTVRLLLTADTRWDTYIQWQVDTGSRESKRRSWAGKRPHSSSHSTPQNRIHERGSLTLTLIQTRSTGTGKRQGSREVCTKEIMQRLKQAQGNTGEPGLAQWPGDEPRSAEILNRPEVIMSSRWVTQVRTEAGTRAWLRPGDEEHPEKLEATTLRLKWKSKIQHETCATGYFEAMNV